MQTGPVGGYLLVPRRFGRGAKQGPGTDRPLLVLHSDHQEHDREATGQRAVQLQLSAQHGPADQAATQRIAHQVPGVRDHHRKHLAEPEGLGATNY